eukprot:m.53718 g.53718  ORF g.53718 m.53718 type:complete len:166 (+) comp7475_c1_seq1:601-1098(+)
MQHAMVTQSIDELGQTFPKLCPKPLVAEYMQSVLALIGLNTTGQPTTQSFAGNGSADIGSRLTVSNATVRSRLHRVRFAGSLHCLARLVLVSHKPLALAKREKLSEVDRAAVGTITQKLESIRRGMFRAAMLSDRGAHESYAKLVKSAQTAVCRRWPDETDNVLP